jgi:hypothetical protein
MGFLLQTQKDTHLEIYLLDILKIALQVAEILAAVNFIRNLAL